MKELRISETEHGWAVTDQSTHAYQDNLCYDEILYVVATWLVTDGKRPLKTAQEHSSIQQSEDESPIWGDSL